MIDQELNEAVARKLGWSRLDGAPCWSDPNGISHGDDLGTGVPDYCHSIEVAWEVVEFINKKHYIGLEKGVLDPQWLCSINWNDGPVTDFVILEFADTAPRAIALAFLKLK